MKFKLHSNPMEELGTAIGVGLLAGVAGTVAISISQMIEMKITKRQPSSAPVDAVAKVLDVTATSDDKKQKVTQEVHWTYGSSWGAVRGLLSLTGLKSWQATMAHFLAIWGTEQVMLPSLKLAEPINKESPKAIGIDILHHLVYAFAAGFTFNAMRNKEYKFSDLKSIWN